MMAEAPASRFVQAVLHWFCKESKLADATQDFAVRDGQCVMAGAVAQVMEQGGSLVVEAGTGVGKTFAYLVPALLSGERVMVSTATKALQDQLFSRDLPRLLQALGVPARTALLKGRSSYLCLHRLKLARQEHLARNALLTLASIEKWALSTQSGDLAELSGLDERSSVIPLVTSSRENCLGSNCPEYKNCHVMLARKQALAADVVVVNHHLFFADLAVRESGVAELLPTVRIVIFDEAHQLNETGVQFLASVLGTGQLIDFARDVLGAGLQFARGLAEWQEIARDCEMAARDLRLLVGQQMKYASDVRLRWLVQTNAPDGLHPQDWALALSRVEESLDAAAAALDMVSEIAPDFLRLHERARAMSGCAARFAKASPQGLVRWLDVGAQVSLMEAPLDIAETMRGKLLKNDAAIEDADSLGESAHDAPSELAAPAQRAWIFTSATLGDDANLSWFTEPCGLQEAQIVVAQSPFDYPKQGALYLPADVPTPGDAGHSSAIAQIAAQGALRLKGRTMVLTTTLRALRAIGEALTQALAGQLDVLIQGQMSKRELVERFRLGDQHGARGCVLVASASFWEGIDIAGEALQLLIIDKLPFPPPNDPLVQARCERLEGQGRSAFLEYSVAQAAVALKQGAGRLIRRESDRGILVIGDTRLLHKAYGRRLLAALPPMARLSTAGEFESALAALAGSSALDAS